MITAILILFGIIIFGGAVAGAVGLIFYARRSVPGKKTAKEALAAEGLSFRWNYIVLPLAFLLLSVALAAYFYHQLPAEVATHFGLDGTPSRWLGREMAMVLMLTPQLLFVLMASGITWGIAKLGRLFKSSQVVWAQSERILLFMGNVIALPQLILCFAMLDIFSYNSYQRHIIAMPIFLLIVLGLATIALGVLFTLTIPKVKRQLTSRLGQSSKEQQ